MIENTNKMLFSIMKCAISGCPLTVSEKAYLRTANYTKLLSKCMEQDLAHMAYYVFTNEGINCGEYQEAFLSAFGIAVTRSERIAFDTKKIFDLFEKNKIYYIPLKGAVIGAYYPNEVLRQSSDLDILVKFEDIDLACKLITDKFGVNVLEKSDHDVSFRLKSGVHIELHFSLDEGNSLLTDVWNNAKKITEYKYQMCEKDAFLYFVIHAAKHMLNGGCGLKTFSDIYVMENNMKYDFGKYYKELEVIGLKKFFDGLYKAYRVIFYNDESDGFTDLLLDFITNSGSYGTVSSRAVVFKATKRKQGKLFISYKTMKNYYPVVGKCPILFPLFQVVRWFENLFGKKKKVYKLNVKALSSVSSSDANKITNLFNGLGL